MSAPAFEIASVTLYPEPRAFTGAVMLADFHIRYGALVIQGASLIQKDDGSHAIMLPKNGRRCRIFVPEYSVRRDLLQTALAAYRSLAARPLATAPSESSEHPIDR